MAYEEDYRDAKNNSVAVGDRVQIAGWTASDIWEFGESYGVITRITDPDGDMNDYGQVIGIAPRACILFDDGDTEEYSFRMTSQYSPYICADIEKIEKG